MRNELELQLQRDFPFMKHSDEERSPYRDWGCECSDGWFELMHEFCQTITELYECAGKSVDIVIEQIKEKWGTLQIYYKYEDVQNGDVDEITQQLRIDIEQIIDTVEEKSSTVCEECGTVGEIREDMPWIRTLCDNCYKNYLKNLEE